MPQQPLSPFQRVRASIFPGRLKPVQSRSGYGKFFNSLVLHFRPRKVSERTLRLSLTWGLGGMAVVLICLLMGTGILLKFIYQPFPDKAYASILYLKNHVLFGDLIRNIHHWSGNGLLAVAFMHFLRVYFTGAIHPPRQFNWVIGLGLFFAVLFSNLTGYLLPWDQLAYWAITICTGMLDYLPGAGQGLKNLILGGPEVGAATLTNFYAIHTAILPAILIVLMPFHFWRVRKAGGLVIPRGPEEDQDIRGESVATMPNLILREAVAAMVLLAVILIVSMLFNAPLEAKANPGLSPNPTKAPWYFAGVQELLLHFHPLFSLFIIPLIVVSALFSLPYINYRVHTAGVWFTSRKGRRMAAVSGVAAAILTPVGIVADETVLDIAAWMPGVPAFIGNGLIPLMCILSGMAAFYVLVKRKYAATNNEAVQAIFVFILVAFFIMTATGIWFRGPGMQLVWP